MKKLFTVLASLAILAAFAVPASAAEGDVEARIAALEEAFQCSWKFYGSARMTTFWEKRSVQRSVTGLDDDTDMTWALQGNSRIGGMVKLGDVDGRFEYGHTTANGATLRLLYGQWNFGAGKLLVGQDYTPMTFWVSGQAWNGDNCLLGFGQMYQGREQQVKLTFGNFQIAAINPVTNRAVTGFPQADIDTTIPKLAASYDIKGGPIKARISGAYQTYDVVRVVAGAEDEQSVDAWQIATGAVYDMGPFFLKGDLYYGENLANMGQSSVAAATTTGIAGIRADRAAWSGTTIVDAETLGFALIAGFKMNDSITFEVGYGQANNEIEIGGTSVEQDVKAYYMNAAISLAKNVFIVPEIGKLDYGDIKQTGVPDENQGDIKYLGAKWQINF
ncbi:MAG: hypothetical protein R6U13_05700 [Desulfatiglandaceae bacterium]